MVLTELWTSIFAREQEFNREILMFRNLVLVTGNLGHDVVLKVLESGRKVCNFSIAESYPTSTRDEQGKILYDTRWHQVTAWDSVASKMDEYSVKGMHVQVSGYLDYDEFKTVNKEYNNAKIVANDIQLFDFVNQSRKSKINNELENKVMHDFGWDT